jgi:hypothetical protein
MAPYIDKLLKDVGTIRTRDQAGVAGDAGRAIASSVGGELVRHAVLTFWLGSFLPAKMIVRANTQEID